MDAIGADDRVGGGDCAVFEAHGYLFAGLIHNALETFVEVGSLCGDAFDEFVEEVGTVDALHAGCILLGVDERTFVWAFALGMTVSVLGLKAGVQGDGR